MNEEEIGDSFSAAIKEDEEDRAKEWEEFCKKDRKAVRKICWAVIILNAIATLYYLIIGFLGEYYLLPISILWTYPIHSAFSHLKYLKKQEKEENL